MRPVVLVTMLTAPSTASSHRMACQASKVSQLQGCSPRRRRSNNWLADSKLIASRASLVVGFPASGFLVSQHLHEASECVDSYTWRPTLLSMTGC
jgi:hypothetical protein